MSGTERLLNYVNGNWCEPAGAEYLDVPDPATAEVLARVPLTPPAEVDRAARLAAAAFPAWRRVPAPARIQYLFKLKALLEENFEDLSRTITHGERQDPGRRAGRDAARHRECRGGLRHPHHDAWAISRRISPPGSTST